MLERYDCIIIGAGSAGSIAANMLNSAGYRVTLIERDKPGGTCLNYGCDPTKALLHTVKLLHDTRQAVDRGITGTAALSLDWAVVQQFWQLLMDDIRGGTLEEAIQGIRDKGIDVYMADAVFVSEHEVQAGDKTLYGEKILLAIGYDPIIPDIPGLADAGYLTNKTVLYLDRLPERMAILGAGPIGIEFAQMFRRCGVDIIVIEEAGRILNKDDADLAELLQNILIEEGITFKLSHSLESIMAVDAGKQLTLRNDETGEMETLLVDDIVLATGRKAPLENLNIGAAGLELEDNKLIVRDTLQTSVDHIFVVRDASEVAPFTHVASHQAQHIAKNIMEESPAPFEYGAVQWVTYTDPELAHAGQTVSQLDDARIPYQVYEAAISDVTRAKLVGQTDGKIKLLIGEDDKILGGHILASHAGEMIAPVCLALQESLTIDAFKQLILPYPTLTAGITQVREADNTDK